MLCSPKRPSIAENWWKFRRKLSGSHGHLVGERDENYRGRAKRKPGFPWFGNSCRRAVVRSMPYRCLARIERWMVRLFHRSSRASIGIRDFYLWLFGLADRQYET